MSRHRYRMAPLRPRPIASGRMPSSFSQRRTLDRCASTSLETLFRETTRSSPSPAAILSAFLDTLNPRMVRIHRNKARYHSTHGQSSQYLCTAPPKKHERHQAASASTWPGGPLRTSRSVAAVSSHSLLEVSQSLSVYSLGHAHRSPPANDTGIIKDSRATSSQESWKSSRLRRIRVAYRGTVSLDSGMSSGSSGGGSSGLGPLPLAPDALTDDSLEAGRRGVSPGECRPGRGPRRCGPDAPSADSSEHARLHTWTSRNVGCAGLLPACDGAARPEPRASCVKPRRAIGEAEDRIGVGPRARLTRAAWARFGAIRAAPSPDDPPAAVPSCSRHRRLGLRLPQAGNRGDDNEPQ